jgi:hypothetical protein
VDQKYIYSVYYTVYLLLAHPVNDRGQHSPYSLVVRAGRPGLAGQLPGAQTEALRRHQNGVSKLWFPHAKEYLRKLSALRALALKSVCQPCPRPKNLMGCFKGRPCIGPALLMTTC